MEYLAIGVDELAIGVNERPGGTRIELELLEVIAVVLGDVMNNIHVS